MQQLYTIGIHIYTFLVRVSAFFNPKARLFINGRKNWRKQLAEKIDGTSPYIWFHCASLGEFEQGRPVIEAIKSSYPDYKIILTFFSPSGYEIRNNYTQADAVAYLPVDTRKNAREFIKLVRPEKAFFVKYEFWHNYLSELQAQKIPAYCISAIFRPDQLFFKNNFGGKWHRSVLFRFAHLFVQDEKSCARLQSIGVTNCTVSGDTRFDRVAAIAAGSKEIPIVEKFKSGSKLIVAGSTWSPDEELLAAFINNTDNVKLIIAPHETTPANINKLENLLKKPHVRFSNIENATAGAHQVLIIDSVGFLSSLYRYGEIAYIGGGFGVGIHNILEAATFGLPVIFGPEYKKFREAVELVSAKGAFPIENKNKLISILNNFLAHPHFLNDTAATVKNYVRNNTGATQIIVNKVFNNA